MPRQITRKMLLWLFVAAWVGGASAGERAGHYQPHRLDRAYTPPLLAVDVHTHLGPGTADSLLAHMESWGVERMVSLTPKSASIEEMMADFGRYPDRFAVLHIPDMTGFGSEGWSQRTEQAIRKAAELGAAGIKMYKDFSVYLRDAEGRLVPVDDPRLEVIWATAGELGMPVLVHVGDPERFWMPADDETNYIEDPDWVFHGSEVPFRETILRALERVIAKFPGTTFVGAHVGNRSESPMTVAWMLDSYPNYYVDLSARFGELAKRPRETRWLLEQYADRICFGTDYGIRAEALEGSWAEDSKRFYTRAHRILWTRDHAVPTPFDGNEGPLLTGSHRWAADGLEIDPDALRKIYRETPLKLFFTSSERSQ